MSHERKTVGCPFVPQSPAKPALNALCTKWQRILRLQDWDVKILFARGFDLTAGKQGTIEWVSKKKSAFVKILDPQDYEPAIRWPQDVEKTVVHELLHLHYAPIDDTEGLREMILEQAVECIATALISLDRQTKE